MLILHSSWNESALGLWAESVDRYSALARSWREGHTSGAIGSPVPDTPARGDVSAGGTAVASALQHPYAVPAADLRQSLIENGTFLPEWLDGSACRQLSLPGDHHGPWPSHRLEIELGLEGFVTDATIESRAVECVLLDPAFTVDALFRLGAIGPSRTNDFGHDIRFWVSVAKLVADGLADQRFVPTLVQSRELGMQAEWRLWLHDEAVRAHVIRLVRMMPPAVRASTQHVDDPTTIVMQAISSWTDALVRRVLIADDFEDAVDGRDPDGDLHVAWLHGLLGASGYVPTPTGEDAALMRDGRRWLGRLSDASDDQLARLALHLEEPADATDQSDTPDPSSARSDTWRLSLYLSVGATEEQPGDLVDAESVWSGVAALEGVNGQDLQANLLAELGRAARMYPRLEEALEQTTPESLELTTAQAYDFLRNVQPILEEAGISTTVPPWWNQPSSRIGLRMHIDSPDVAPTDSSGTNAGLSPTRSLLGLRSLVQYRWQVAVGDQVLSLDAFKRLAGQSSPLVRVAGRWVEVHPEDMDAARKFLDADAGGEMPLLDAIQAAYGIDGVTHGLPVFGLDANGWVSNLLDASSGSLAMPEIHQPESFLGELRPYQQRGLSWLAFLDALGLGACLADDMGLGKTIQLIALLLHERETALPGTVIAPTLLIVPTSLIGNWCREIERFGPSLRVHVQHGVDRPMDDDFEALTTQHDVIITTYALVGRDQDTLRQIEWGRVALDEAQSIKNPPTKQATAIRSLRAARRVTLTGTPVENRLSELWSIMEFCNPGYLGGQAEFRRRFAIPIERRRDAEQRERLRQLVRPFILRRLKTDPDVIQDLPACVETKAHATLTREQAALYQRVVDDMLVRVDGTEGIQRRGLVLATLTKLKQICNHPVQFLSSPAEAGNDHAGESSPGSALASRSGKTERLVRLLEEVLATGERALIFTQYRKMGHLLTAMIERDLDADVIFLHGGTPQKKREVMIQSFQEADGPQVFVLSLKAGGVGLNLTAANHVFHFDRWWNPAVEKQATDRAFRIGQTRTVHVHKFVCVGTLEERIDQMIEQKTELAEHVIGSGEDWLTEMTTQSLRDVLTLRGSALDGDS